MVRDTFVIYGLRLAESSEYRYVGQTTGTAQKRYWGHSYDAQPGKSSLKVHNWMRKHGTASVMFDVLEVCPANNLMYLNYAERYWIASLREFGHDLLNLTDGGDGVSGLSHPHTAETRRKISNSLLGTTRSPETRRRMSEAKKGVSREPQSDETIRQIAAKNRGKKRSEDFRQDVSSRMIGNSHATGTTRSAESIARLSASKVGALNPAFGKTPSQSTIDKRRISFHASQHVSKNRISLRCPHCPSTD